MRILAVGTEQREAIGRGHDRRRPPELGHHAADRRETPQALVHQLPGALHLRFGSLAILHASDVPAAQEQTAVRRERDGEAGRAVRRLNKGPERPLVRERDRAEVLAALEMVDYVTIFGQDTPYQLIKATRPDVLVKGGDWTVDRIVGADLVLANGGKVKSLRFAPGYSTTNLVKKIATEGHRGAQRKN